MNGIAIVHREEAAARAGYAAPNTELVGTATSRMAEFPGFSLWVATADLEAGSELRFSPEHGDEALYVRSGALEVAGRTCPQGGVLIIEAGSPAAVRAVSETSVIHFGPRDHQPPTEGQYGPPAPGPRSVHVIGPGGTYAANEPGRDTRMFAVSTCET